MAPISEPHKRRAASVGAEKKHPCRPEEEKQVDSPVHPVPQLQGPFDESILEAVQGMDKEWVVDLDAQTRRRDLLENVDYERLCGRRWRQRPSERYHPFWKLISQLVFGVHLLVTGQAKSDAEVVKILQTHVDEIDGFVERTSEDFLIIQLDLRTRIQYLSLPLQNLDAFDGMLTDRNFRHSMVKYNDLIEHAVGRFSIAVKDALKDIQKGKEAIKALWHYLFQSATDNTPLPMEMQAVYDAMAANIEGWNIAFAKLRKRGSALESALSQLAVAVTEMQRRVGVASRKDMFSLTSTSESRAQSRSWKERLFEKGASISEKPLPRDPAFDGKASKFPGSRRMTSQQSVPNLKATRGSDSSGAAAPKAPSRARSANETNTQTHSTTSSVVPKVPKSLSRKLSMAVFPKRSVSDNNVTAHTRPSTLSSGTIEPRGASSEQSRASDAIQDASIPEVPSVPPAATPTASRPSTRQETMKNQIMHYFKTDDRVADAWEDEGKKEKKISRRSSIIRKDGPLSIFRMRSSTAARTTERPQTAAFENDIERQMTWLRQETAIMNTYSLKPQRDEAPPRIHVLSIESTLPEEPEEEDNVKDDYVEEAESVRGDAESIITALPAFPLPPTMSPHIAARTSSLGR